MVSTITEGSVEPSISVSALITAHCAVTVFGVGRMTDTTVNTTETLNGRCGHEARHRGHESRHREILLVRRVEILAAVVTVRRSGRRRSGRRTICGVTDVGVTASICEETCVAAQIFHGDLTKATRVGERAAWAASYRAGVASVGRDDVC